MAAARKSKTKPRDEALRESEELYRALVRASPDAITISDLKGNITEVSEQTLMLHGFKKVEDLIGRSAFELIAPEDHEKALEGLNKTLKTGTSGTRQYTLLRKDGSRFIGELNASMVRDSNGKPKAFIATTRDITRQKEAEDALEKHRGQLETLIQKRTAQLKASEEKFKALVETTPDWVWEVNEKAQYTYVSPRVKDLLGYTPDEVLGKTPFDLMPRNEAARISTIFGEIARKKESFFALENINLHKKGHEVVLETSGVPLVDESGNLQGYRGIDRDITERKQAEEERLKLQEQELLEKYAELLEKRVQSLEKDRITLGKNERIVLSALTGHPRCNDTELSIITGMRRPTITTIRNRLKKKGWYRKVNVPNLQSLRLNTISVYYCEKSPHSKRDVNQQIFSRLRQSAWCVFALESGTFSLALAAYTGHAEARQHFESVISQSADKNSYKHITINRIFLPTGSIVRFLDYGPLLGHLFGTSHSQEDLPAPPDRRLLRSEKQLLHAFTRFPWLNNSEIHLKTGISKPTILKARHALFGQGFIRRLTLPDTARLDHMTACLTHQRFSDPLYKKRAALIERIKEDSSIIFSVVDEEQYLNLHLFDNPASREKAKLEAQKTYREILGGVERLRSFTFQNAETIKLGFSDLIQQLFNLDIKY